MKSVRYLVCLLVALALITCQKKEEPATADTSGTTSTAAPQQEIQYTAINQSVFVPEATVNGWINATPINTAAITQHAWAIWGGMTAPSNQTINGQPVPVWETWYDSTEVYAAAPGSGSQQASNDTNLAKANAIPHKTTNPKRRFHFPHQLFKGKALGGRALTASGSTPGILVTFNRFTQEIKDWVAQNQYYDSGVLTNLNSSWTSSTPLQNRTILTFPDTSIMLKPVFWVVSGTQPTVVPYWNGAGPNATTSTDGNPTPDTWKQCVLADPTGQATNSQPINCNGITIAAGTYKVVPVSANPSQSAFYAVALTQDVIDDLKAINQNEVLGASNVTVSQLQPGDLALFVATHVSTREIDNWTWQTFWWSPTPQQVPSDPPNSISPPSSITAPWNNYVGCTAYYMVTPPTDENGQPLFCYNPYLETGLGNILQNESQTATATGTSSNCMTCHRAAAWSGNPYAQAFLLQPNDPIWFSKNTKTDFLWSMVNFAHTAPFIPPPSPAPSGSAPTTTTTQ